MAQWTGETIDGEPVTMWDQVYEACRKHQLFVLTVEKFDEKREISRRQMRYLHGVVFPTLAKEMHISLWEAEFQCKTGPGEQWLVKRVGDLRFILSKTSLSVPECTAWIQNIFDWADRNGVFVPPPDREWWDKSIKPV